MMPVTDQYTLVTWFLVDVLFDPSRRGDMAANIATPRLIRKSTYPGRIVKMSILANRLLSVCVCSLMIQWNYPLTYHTDFF